MKTNEIRGLIAKGKLDEAMDMLWEVANDKHFEHDLIQLNGHFNHLQRRLLTKGITAKEVQQKEQQLATLFSNFVDKLEAGLPEEKEMDFPEVDPEAFKASTHTVQHAPQSLSVGAVASVEDSEEAMQEVSAKSRSIPWVGVGIAAALVLGLAYFLFLRAPADFNVTFSLVDENGQKLSEQTATLALEVEGINGQAIGEGAEVQFSGIPANLDGQKVKVLLNSIGFELADNSQEQVLQRDGHIVLNAKALYKVIAGKVTDEQGQALADAEIIFKKHRAKTDANGQFELKLADMGDQKSFSILAVKEGYISKNLSAQANGEALSIQLSEEVELANNQ